MPDLELPLALPEGAIEGRVLDATSGQPIVDAQVSLVPEAQPVAEGLLGSLLMGSESTIDDYTDAEGNFRFDALQAGNYRLSARGPYWGEGAGEWAPSQVQGVELAERELRRDIEFRLQPSLRILGALRDELGNPVSDARVLAFAEGRADLEAERAGSDAEGRFALRGLAPQAYSLEVRKEGFATQRLNGVAAAPQPEERQFVLRRGVEVVLLVSDSSGAPLQGAAGKLTASAEQDRPREDAEAALSGWFNGKSLTNTEGRQKLGRYLPGRYLLEVRRAASVSKEEVEIRAGDTQELRVRMP